MEILKNEIDRTRQEAGGLVAMLFVAAVIFAGLTMGGCASMEAYVGVRRSDTSTETRSAVDKPLKCFFTDCNGGK